jgi:type I restriction enzyme, S subunit
MKHWPTVPLGDFVAKKSGSVDPSNFPDEVFDLYSIPAFDSGQPEVRAGNEIGSAKQLVHPKDILLSRIVPHIRRAWVVGENRGRRLIAAGEWIVFHSPQIHPRYMRFFLVGDPFHARFMQTVSGVGGSLLRAKASEVAKIQIPVPPLEEQERIVKLLDEADKLRKLRAQADSRTAALIPALFHEMFGDLDGTKHPISELAIVAQVVSGVAKGRRLNSHPTMTVPYLRVANVQAGRLDLSEMKTIEALPSEVGRFHPTS